MQLSNAQYCKARDFILTNARMIERRLFHYHFEQGDRAGVYHADYAISTKGTNVHVMNKFSLGRIIDEEFLNEG